MENKENQAKEEPKDAERVENLSVAELENVVGGTANLNLSKSNVNAAAAGANVSAKYDLAKAKA